MFLLLCLLIISVVLLLSALVLYLVLSIALPIFHIYQPSYVECIWLIVAYAVFVGWHALVSYAIHYYEQEYK